MSGWSRARAGYVAALAGAGVMLVGGIVDLFLPSLMAPHERFLGASPGTVPPETSSLVLLLLHTLGAALIGLSLAIIALLHAWWRTGLVWPAIVAVLAAALAEGVNVYGIIRVGSPVWVGPAVAVALIAGGVAVGTAGRRASRAGPSGS